MTVPTTSGAAPPPPQGPAVGENASAASWRYLIRFEEDTLRHRPLWVRVIVEFLGTAMLVVVAAGSGVINAYAGGDPVSRTAAVIAPGALVMALIYALGPVSGLHINPAVTIAFAVRGVFRRSYVVPYLLAQLAGAVTAALFLQLMFGHVAAGGNYPIATPGGQWRSFVMEVLLTTMLVTVILNTATGSRSIGHNAALAVGGTVAPRPTSWRYAPRTGRRTATAGRRWPARSARAAGPLGGVFSPSLMAGL
jgi:aquaporin Z